MDSEDRRELEDAAHRIVKAVNRRGVVTGTVGALVFMILQTAVILIGARLTSQEGQSLANRVDRNAAVIACVLSVGPEDRTSDIFQICLTKANERFGDEAPLMIIPTPGLPRKDGDGR